MSKLFEKSAEALDNLLAVLNQLPDQASYSATCRALSDASIGQHTRHIIELYQCLLAGYETGIINYDDRKRNVQLEKDINLAMHAVHDIKLNLQRADKEVFVHCLADEESVSIKSNYYREVLYNLEHCIHHQALIRVALLTIDGLHIAADFGVAHSTLQYRQQCAQ